jgi:hypothetical protein
MYNKWRYTSKFRASAMLLVLMKDNFKRQQWDVHQWNKVHTKFPKNQSTGGS